MKRKVAFLRSINVGRRRVKGVQLAAVFTDLGFANAASFLASGNVVFDVPDSYNADLSTQIEEALLAELGFSVSTIIRSAAQVTQMGRAELFTEEQLAASTGKVQVAILAKRPTPANKAKVLKLANVGDLLAFEGEQLYWLPAGNMSDSQLDLDAIGKFLGLQTWRTRNTLQRLTQKFLLPLEP